MKTFLIGLLCLIWAGNASAFCRQETPWATVETKPGFVRYLTHLSREEFLKQAPQKMSPNTLGMTVSKLGISGSAEPNIQKINNSSVCVQIKEFKLILGYDTLDVYIDKKYQPDTCEYEVVKEHENYHVRVSQEAMSFFRPDVEKALNKALAKIKPETAHSSQAAQKIFERQFSRVIQELKPLIDHINKKIAEKNYIIDTPESYARTTALCKDW